MRKIRFRAWDKQDHNWFHPIYKAYQGELDHLVLWIDTGELTNVELDNDRNTFLYGDRQYVLEQYSGLNDKNDTKIYEGDILKIRTHVKLAETDLDKWVNDYIEVVYRTEYSGYYIGEDPLWISLADGVDRDSMCYQEGAVVVGNIHENPELLEE